MTRHICYISGSRADFGLMRATLETVHRHPDLRLSIIVTGMHLVRQFGETVRDIEESGLPITTRIPVNMEPTTGQTMARNIGIMLGGMVDHLALLKPDILLVLGDRGEMLAGALAALHLNIHIAHSHGGERSGTIDEPVRHAISKLSHFHFTATENARVRLMSMGERADHIWTTGAPGLDGIQALASRDRAELATSVQFDANRPIALLCMHPVLQEAAHAGEDAALVLSCLITCGFQVLALLPNSDAGSAQIRSILEKHAATGAIRVETHLRRADFVSWMAAVDLMAGNSSAGIIEAASFGTPVLNVGTRQHLRERSSNVTDAPIERTAIEAALNAIRARGRLTPCNVYGDGSTAGRIVELLRRVPLTSKSLVKANEY
jgi:GDP/UDP-N,N'-diacetylbacillosamine 2-epimerase (hydrolysing)